MRHLQFLTLALALVFAGASPAQEAALIGQFTTIDRTMPSCGVLFVGSPATFVTRSGQEITLVIPCPEMQKAATASGGGGPLELHRTYRILVSSVRPHNLNIPAPSSKSLYLVRARELEVPSAC